MEKVKAPQLLYLNRSHIESLGIGYEEIVNCVKQSFELKGKGDIDLPPKFGLHLKDSAFYHAMPAYVGGEVHSAGVKWVSVYPKNFEKKLPAIQAMIMLNDADNGTPLALIDGSWITEHRTAGAGAVAAEFFAPKEFKTVAVIGLGKIGTQHFVVMKERFAQIQEFFLYDPFAEQAKRVKAMAEKLPGGIKGVTISPDVESAVRNADVILTSIPMTAGGKPIIKKEWIKETATIIAQDYDAAFEGGCISQSEEFIVDDTKQYLFTQSSKDHFQEYPSKVDADIGEILTGKCKIKEGVKRRAVVMLGIATHDLVCASYIYKTALKKNIGQLLDL